MTLPGHDLTQQDFDKLGRGGIPIALARQALLRRVDSHEGAELVGRNGSGDYSGIVFPYVAIPGDAEGCRSYRLRRDQPDLEQQPDGTIKETQKYLAARESRNYFYLIPGTEAEWLADTSLPIVIVEGEKKALSLWTAAFAGLGDAAERPRFLPIGLSGVWNYRGVIGQADGPAPGKRRAVRGIIPDFDRFVWNNRKTTVLFDTNVNTDVSVAKARTGLSKELRRRSSLVHWFVWPANTPDGVNGVDDLIGHWGIDRVLALIAEAPPRRNLRSSTGTRSNQADDDAAGRLAVRICSNGRQLRNVSDAALLALQEANNPPELFARADMMVAIITNNKGVKTISPVGEPALRGRLTRTADYYQVNSKGEESSCSPPIDVVRDILSLPSAAWRFPTLEGLTEIPVIRPDGTILDTPGYDVQTGLYYARDPNLDIPEIQNAPTSRDIEAARGLIEEVICDFPFVDQASKANAIAGFMTPIMRPAIGGPVPLQVNDAPQMGTGKSLVADIISIIATGRAGEMFSAPKEEDEWRKQITMALLTGTSVVVIDNVTRPLESGELCKVLTATQYVDRKFHTHDKILLPVHATFIATGNNIQLRGDMPRRCYLIRIDAKDPRPFLRTGFKHPDLKDWVTTRRGDILAALLTLATAWFAAGKRKPEVKPLGGFEAWTVTIGGILEHAGIPGFLDNATELYDEADTESQEWQGFLEVLKESFYEEAFTAADLDAALRDTTWNAAKNTNEPTKRADALRQAVPEILAGLLDKPVFSRRVGRCFGERVDRQFGTDGIHLKREPKLHGLQRWKVLKKAPPADPPTTSAL